MSDWTAVERKDDKSDDKPEVSPAQALKQKAAEKVTALSEGEDIYVPVVNVNYIPEGIVRLEGYVNPLSGGILEDQNIIGQKIALEDNLINPLESGPHPDNDWVDPSPDAPIDGGEGEGEGEGTPLSPTESDTSQTDTSGDPNANDPNSPAVTDDGEPGNFTDKSNPSNQTQPDKGTTSGLGL